MPTRLRLLVLLIGVAAALASFTAGVRRAVTSHGPDASSPATAEALQRGIGPVFVQNQGQFDGAVRFAAQGSGATWFLTDDALWVSMASASTDAASACASADTCAAGGDSAQHSRKTVALKLSFPGAASRPLLEPFDRLETHVSFFQGNDPAQWRTDVPAFSGVRYRGLYPGVDLELSGVDGAVQPRLVAGPGADLAALRLRLEGADGVSVAPNGGSLTLSTAIGNLSLPLLQSPAATTQPSVVASRAGAFDVVAPFTAATAEAAAPVARAAGDLAYSTYLHSTGGYDSATGIAVDSSGNAYIVGQANAGFPTTAGVFQSNVSGGFVTKINPNGSGNASLVYSTYITGHVTPGDGGYPSTLMAVAVDSSGDAYVTGRSWAADYPVTQGAYQSVCPMANAHTYGCWGTMVTKLNPTGTGLLYSTFLSGTGYEAAAIGESIAVNTNGEAYLTGQVQDGTYPTTSGAFETTCGGCNAGFLTKLNASGSGLVYSTFLNEAAIGYHYTLHVAVDNSGYAYLAGSTRSSTFPVTAGAYLSHHTSDQNCPLSTPCADAFFTKFNANGTGLLYSTYLGGSGESEGQGVAVDSNNNAYVTGWTDWAQDFPATSGSYQTTSCSTVNNFTSCDIDGFVTKFNPSASGAGSIVYSAFIRGAWAVATPDAGAQSIAVDSAGNAYIAGATGSTHFPVTPGAYQTTCNTCSGDGGSWQLAFMAKLSASGSSLLYATYLGGAGTTETDKTLSIAVDSGGNAYLTGQTIAPDFPVTATALQSTKPSGQYVTAAFFSKFGIGTPVGSPPIASPDLSAVADGAEVFMVGRSPQNALWYRETSAGTFGNWTQLVASGVASRPKAVAVGSDLLVFFRASTNELHYVRRTAGTWGTEQNLGGQIAGSPAAAVDGSGTLIVGVLNSAGNVFVDQLPSGGAWGGFQSLAGVLTGRLDLVAYSGDVYLFGINGGGVLWDRQWNHVATSWGSWTPLDGVLSSAPDATVFGSSLYVFAINPGGILWYRALSSGTWGAWTSLDGVLGNDPSAAATASTLLAFGTNLGGSLWDRRSTGSFGAWDPLDGVLATGPVAVTAGTQTYVFGINAAGNTWYRVWNGSSFGTWQNLGGILATE